MENTRINALDFWSKCNLDGKMDTVQMMVAYAASVRNEVVLPSEKEIAGYVLANPGTFNGSAKSARFILSQIKSLNPDITFKSV